jgi:hypothetical protein
VVGRGFGGQDLALAGGTLITLKDERAVATWLRAGALSDAADAVSTLVAFRKLGSVRRLLGGDRRRYNRAGPEACGRRRIVRGVLVEERVGC